MYHYQLIKKSYHHLVEVLSYVKEVRIADIASYIYLQSRDRNSHSLRSQSSVEI